MLARRTTCPPARQVQTPASLLISLAHPPPSRHRSHAIVFPADFLGGEGCGLCDFMSSMDTRKGQRLRYFAVVITLRNRVRKKKYEGAVSVCGAGARYARLGYDVVISLGSFPLSSPPRPPPTMLATYLAAVVGSFLGHGSMIMPPSRNSIDSLLPAWSNGRHAVRRRRRSNRQVPGASPHAPRSS